MNTEEKPIVAADPVPGIDVESRLRAEQVADLVLNFGPPPPLDLPGEDFELPPQHREALRRLGDAPTFLNNILAKLEAEEAAAAEPATVDSAIVDPATCIEEAATEETVTEDCSKRSSSARNLEELGRLVEEFEKTQSLCRSSNYHKTKVLGRGGQGVVYLAEGQDDFGSQRAMKIFSPEPYCDTAAYYEDMKQMRRVAKLVHRHPHDDLLDVEWFGEQDGVYLMLMQLIDGYDLRQLLQRSLLRKLRMVVDEERWRYLLDVVFTTLEPGLLALKPAIAVYIIERCLRGLEALHGLGVVHGDIKPSNVMLDSSGGLRLVDIGSAFELALPPRAHSFTPQYAAPEVLEGGEWTVRCDLASLGYVLIELLTGRPATPCRHTKGRSTRQFHKERDSELLAAKRELPGRIRELLPERIQYSDELVKLCEKLVQPDPALRHSSASEAIENPDGTFGIHQSLVRSDLAVSNFQEIRRILGDVNKTREEANQASDS